MNPFRYQSPRLRFVDPPEVPTGGGTGDGATPPPPGTPPGTPDAPPAPATGAATDSGFPANTSPNDMTAEQQVAYWKAQSRSNENKFKNEKRRADDLTTQHQTEGERREAELRAEGAKPFIRSAIAAQVQLGTGKTPEQVATILEHVDVAGFLANGALDPQKVATYAESLGVAQQQQTAPPATGYSSQLHAAGQLQRTGPGGAPVSTSIRDRRKELVENRLGRGPAK